MPAGGALEITGYAFEASYMFELGPQDCGTVSVVQSAMVCPAAATMTIAGEPGSLVWFWFGPQGFWSGHTYEYDYVLYLNLEPVAVADHSWSAVKGLFR